MGSGNAALPVEFLTALAMQAAPASAVATFVAEQARTLVGGPDRHRLLSVLLAGPYSASAPGWLLDAAIGQGLDGTAGQWHGSGIELAATALGHTDCTEPTRQRALQSCAEAQLASLGTARRATALTQAVAAELRRRSPRPVPMTRALVAEPTPAQVVLRTGYLGDAVFEAAFELLPARPDRPDRTTIDDEAGYKTCTDDVDAWTSMWKAVLENHPDRHKQIVDLTEEGPANYTVRHLLLGTMPWAVEPELLKTLATADLAKFHTAVLTTRLCRALRDGASKQDARNRFADQIDDLPTSDQRHVNVFLEEDGFDPGWGCREAISWASYASDKQWRLLLNPDQAKPKYGGDPYPWRIAQDDLAELGRCFAQTTAVALELWEPDPDRLMRGADELRWVADVLTHLSDVTDAVKDSVRLLIADTRKNRSRIERYATFEDRNTLDGLIARIEKILADPAPNASARRTALGDPAHVTVRELTAVSVGALATYLDRHAGDDDLVEKALLAIASANYGPRNDFRQVLDRHSDPQRAIADITRDLRRRLGGNPPAREAWAGQVLALPFCDTALIRALPAWATLQIGGGGAGRAHPEVLDAVIETLGEDAAAWTRLAESPISHTGPNAWLRLGDVLDAARSGAAWPTAPATR